jgi:hypothetical protein
MSGDQLFLLGCVVVPVLIGLALIWYARRQRARGEAARQWPTAPGTILQSYVGERSTTAEDAGTTSVAVVSYSYRVSGRDYQSSRLGFGGEIQGGRDAMAKLVAEYPAGASVAVPYNPDKPEDAVLRPDITRASTTIFRGGVVIVGIGVFVAAMLVWRLTKFGAI